MPLFSIIIVTHHSAREIASCLESMHLTEGVVTPFEVIIVDNASADATLPTIRQKFGDVALIENKENVGYGAAVNQAAARARGDILLILNPDTMIRENFLQDLSSFLEKTSDAAIVGCRIVDANGALLASCWTDPGLQTVFWEMFLPHRIALPLITEKPTCVKEVDMVSGACMAVKREVFEQLGGFDEQFFLYYEDADLCLRARQKGYKVYYEPAISVVHYVGASTDDDFLFSSRVYRSKLLFLRKHRPAWYAETALIMMVIGLLIRIPSYVLAGSVSFNKRLLRLAKVHTFVLKRLVDWWSGEVGNLPN